MEANPLRARLAERAGQWPWSTDALLTGDHAALFREWPLPRPADWRQLVEARWKDSELSEIRTSLDRGRPLGEEGWTL